MVGPGDPRCSYVEAGAEGPQDNRLELQGESFSEQHLIRKGNEVVVLSASYRPIDCIGPTPTVTNIDSIRATYPGDYAYGPTLDLRGGRFAPGATAESDKTSEIEVEIGGSPAAGLFISGTNRRNWLELGTLADGRIGVNLNARTEPSPDVDVTMPAGADFGAELFDGNDRVDASGGSLLPDSPADIELFLRSAGANADVLIAGLKDAYMVGGTGRDRIIGGQGDDRIGAGPGDDSVFVRGGGDDAVQCGRGTDAYDADKADDVRLCEDPRSIGVG